MSDLLRNQPETLPGALIRAARSFADRGISILDGRGRSADRRSFRQLLELATAAGARFATLGLAPREPVMVALPTSWEWMEAWFGVLVAGGWPVAMSGGAAMGAPEAHLERMDRVRERIGARFVVCGSGLVEQGRVAGSKWVENAMTPEQLRAASPDGGFRVASGAADDVAFLQLTSGSTGLPRAVMITHRAVVHNTLASCEWIGMHRGGAAHTWADAMVSWLPLYHDMGLVGTLLLCMITGLDAVLMRPTTFLARPGMWFQAFARSGTTFAAAPNFGFQLCVERIKPESMTGVDLSGWRSANTGAEMIRPESVRAFCDRFECLGFRPEVFQPCYGLAEATLSVTFDVEGRGLRTVPAPPDADVGFGLTEVVSTGKPIPDTDVRAVAPDGSVLPDGRVGEIQIRGPGVLAGYFNDPEATAESLRDGWFSTGDLGFILDGELYLTGRIKDVLIVRGVNLMPDDLERIADSVTGGGGLLRAAAFSVARGAAGEEPVLVVETAERSIDRLPGLESAIRTRIGRALGLPLADVVFVRRGRIPRTTSGKMQRGEVRRRYLDGTLERIDLG